MGTVGPWHELIESEIWGIADLTRGVDQVRRWLGIRPGVGLARPSPEFFDVLFARGREQAIATLEEFSAGLEDVSSPQNMRIWRALQIVARKAERLKLISWNLNSWHPAGAAAGTRRLVVGVDAPLAEAIRTTVFNRRETVATFLRRAAERELHALEREAAKAQKAATEKTAKRQPRRRTRRRTTRTASAQNLEVPV